MLILSSSFGLGFWMQGSLLDSGGRLVRNDLQGVMFGECLEKYGGCQG